MTAPMTPAQRLEAAGAWLVALGGQGRTADLGAALGLNGARQADVQRALREAGLAEGPRGVLALTAAGWTRFGLLIGSQEGAGEVLEVALEGWPQRHRAFVELLVAAVIARHHLAEVRPAGHLGFMAIGPTGTGKSSAGQAACHLFGWDPVNHELDLPSETVGSLLGRRVQGPEGWTFDPAAATRWPLVVLDEFDKASEPEQRAAFRYLQGKVRQRLGEGHVVHLAPIVLLTTNPPARGDRYGGLRQEYRRRSVVWDTADFAGRGSEIGRRILALEAHCKASPTHRLHLERLRPPRVLSDEASALLESAAVLLTDAGREEYDVPPLEAATLGRCALIGPGADDGLAALATLVAYLQVSESRPGQVRPDWPARVAALREDLGEGADVERLMAALERGSVAQRAAQEVVHAGHRRAARTSLEVQEQAAALAERLRLAHDGIDGRKMPTEHRTAAAGLRRVLRSLRESASRVSTAAALAEVSEQALDPTGALLRAEQLARDVAAAADQRRADAQAQRHAEALDRRAAAGARQHAAAAQRRQREQASEQLREVVDLARRLEGLYARATTRDDEHPLAVLAALEVRGYRLLTYAPPPPVEPAPAAAAPSGLRARLTAARQQRRQDERPGTWQTLSTPGAPAKTYAGWPGHCTALAAWGPATRAVLRPALEALHASEDQLRAIAGGRRRARPVLHETAPAAPALPRSPRGGGGRLALPSGRPLAGR